MAKKYLFPVLILLFIIILAGFLIYPEDTLENPSSDFSISVLSETPRIICIDGTFSTTLMDGVTYTVTDSGTIALLDNNAVIGGIQKYPAPRKNFPDPLNFSKDEVFYYLSELGITVNLDELTAKTISTGLHNGLEVWLHSDTMDITHNLFPCESWIYDIWFDTSQEANLKYFTIFESVDFVEK